MKMEKQKNKHVVGSKKNQESNKGLSIKEVGNGTQTKPHISNSSMATPTSSSALIENHVKPFHPPTNLDTLIRVFAPYVPIQSFTTNYRRGWENGNSNLINYFKLEDLWETYREWSAYGVGVPLLLGDKTSVVQYYTPYLSAIQLYVNPSKPPPRSRQPQKTTWSNDNVVHSNIQAGIAPSNQNGDEALHHFGKPIFEYFEEVNPYSREPLTDKVFKLATHCPELKSYRSCDLKSSSWVSVAWYPIYRIPAGRSLDKIKACFLTFHSLGGPKNSVPPFPEEEKRKKCESLWKDNDVKDRKFQVPIFGIEHYKLKGSVWNSDNLYESQQALSMRLYANDWVSVLGIHYPDYKFFKSHSLKG